MLDPAEKVHSMLVSVRLKRTPPLLPVVLGPHSARRDRSSSEGGGGKLETGGGQPVHGTQAPQHAQEEAQEETYHRRGSRTGPAAAARSPLPILLCVLEISPSLHLVPQEEVDERAVLMKRARKEL